MRVLLLVLCLFSSGLTLAGETKAAPKAAVLRLEEALRSCKYYSVRRDGLLSEQVEAKKTLKDMDEQLKQLDNQLQVLPKSNERFAKVQEEFEVKKLQQKMFAERISGTIDRRHLAIIKESYATLRQLLKEFAKERGLALVHLAPDGDLKAPTMPEVQLELGLQTVLYFDESLDVTSDFIQFVNAKFAAEKPSADAKPASEGQGAGK